MTNDLRVPLPLELEPFRADLEYFFSTMVRKMYINRHKGFGENSLNDLVEHFQNEVKEVLLALKEESQFNTAIECADCANQAFLIALKVWAMTKPEYKETQEPVLGPKATPSYRVLPPEWVFNDGVRMPALFGETWEQAIERRPLWERHNDNS